MPNDKLRLWVSQRLGKQTPALLILVGSESRPAWDGGGDGGGGGGGGGESES